jgi:hypothetical protein
MRPNNSFELKASGLGLIQALAVRWISMHLENKAFCTALSFALAGSVSTGAGPLKTYPEAGKRIGQGTIEDAVAHGATSCRYNLEDLVVHAIGGRDSDGVATYPTGDAARRPFSAIYATKYSNGETANVQMSVGPDASGFCSVSWTESRFWKNSCSEVIAVQERYGALNRSKLGDSILLSDDGTLRVLMSDVPNSGCLVTESDVAWRIDPDEAARTWILEDHGYDPAAPASPE